MKDVLKKKNYITSECSSVSLQPRLSLKSDPYGTVKCLVRNCRYLLSFLNSFCTSRHGHCFKHSEEILCYGKSSQQYNSIRAGTETCSTRMCNKSLRLEQNGIETVTARVRWNKSDTNRDALCQLSLMCLPVCLRRRAGVRRKEKRDTYYGAVVYVLSEKMAVIKGAFGFTRHCVHWTFVHLILYGSIQHVQRLTCHLLQACEGEKNISTFFMNKN